MAHDVFGIGNALVDIEVRVSNRDLRRLKLTRGAMKLTTAEEQQQLLESLQSRIQNVCSGGSAANTMHGIGALGGDAYFLGRVASDEYGQLYTEDMEQCGVGFPGPGAPETGTGTSLVLVTPDGQRTLVTHLGISTTLNAGNVDPTILDQSKVAYVEGYLWDAPGPRAAAMRVAERANDQGIALAFTLSDAFLINRYREELLQFVHQHVDILFCNEVEACAMAATDDPLAAFRQMTPMVQYLFLTRGGKGAVASHRGDGHVHADAFPTEVVDTTGAGDLFAAGALYGLTHGHSLEQCCILGSWCGSRIVGQLGARLGGDFTGRLEPIFDEYASMARQESSAG